MRILCLGFWLLFSAQCPVYAQTDEDRFRLRVDVLASADRDIRDIDIHTVTLSTPALRRDPFTLNYQAGAISTTGQSIEPNALFYSDADALGVFAGGSLRMSPHESLFVKPFVEGGISLLLTDRPFPDDPSLTDFQARIYGKFDVRWGVEILLSERISLESAFAFTHISNGSGFGPQNINFDGIGLTFGLSSHW